jgi:alkaline phosphatase D
LPHTARSEQPTPDAVERPGPPPLDRRSFLGVGAGVTGLLLAPGLAGSTPLARSQARFDFPFNLGVASGDPTPDGAVLWTRLAPNPLAGDGAMPPEPVAVQWEIATDEAMSTVVRRGESTAVPALGHSVHVEAAGLEPGRDYWYRFRAGGHLSPAGRTRTLPSPSSSPARLSFAIASCQHFESGFYAAYRHMATQDLDLVFHLGDYIYEGGPGVGLRRHATPEPTTLAGYRARYGQYKNDTDLRAAHAAAPFVVTWDDHEVDNDYAGDISQDFDDPALFRARRAAAYQAWYEHMPVRAPLPGTPWADYRIYRRLRFGDLAEFNVLDTRQYRDDQACGAPGQGGGRTVDDAGCPERLAPGRSMLGAEQFGWLTGGLSASDARWNVIAQQYLMGELDRNPFGGRAWGTDAWDGYPAERARLLGLLAERQVRNPVTLGGDIHTFLVTDLKPDFRDPRSPVVATEFVTTSISSLGGDLSVLLPDNPHIRYTRNERGYTRCTVTRDTWRADLLGLGFLALPWSRPRTLASWVVEDGRPGATRA